MTRVTDAPTLSEGDIAEIQSLIAHSTLRSIEHHEISARRHEAVPDGVEPPLGTVTIGVQQRLGRSDFAIRLNADVLVAAGQASASVAGEYVLIDDHRPSRRALQLFANEVAVMTVFPYLREAVASVTSRVFGTPLHLPTVERGEIVLDVAEPGT